MSATFQFLVRIGRDSGKLYWDLIKIMVPVMIAVKAAVMLGLIDVLSAGFEPLMTLVGLPSEMGLVWATACLVNIYASAAALLGVMPEAPLTVAQMTILGSLILIAHSIPLEQRVCQKAGAGFLFTSGLRMVVALVYGIVLNLIYTHFNVLQEPVSVAWLPQGNPDAGLVEWAQDSVLSLVSLFPIILALVVLLRLMDVTGVTRLLTRALSPLLSIMGIGSTATPLTMIGVLLGLTYGSGLIIREAQTGKLPPRDIVLSLSFMAICHSLIEDTLFMMALGAHWSGVLVGRFVFAFVIMVIIARVVRAMPERTFRKLLFTGRPAEDGAAV